MRWFVAQTKPCRERLAIFHLQNQGFRTFHPHIITRTREGDKRQQMFPSYVFVEFDMADDRWCAIKNTLGIQRLLGQSQECPTPVPQRMMDVMIAAGDMVDDVSRVFEFLPGDKLTFTQGPLSGHSGVVQAASKNRVQLLLSVLGRPSVVYSSPLMLRSAALDAQPAPLR